MSEYQDYRLGYVSRNEELNPVELSISGQLPVWLTGDLVRNGPAKYEIGDSKLNHWFDGYAKLHKFSFAQNKIYYSCKFIQSAAYKKAIIHQKIYSNEFATNKKTSLFQKVFSGFKTDLTDNTNVNICRFQDKYLTLTETQYPMQFDLPSLNTIGKIDYNDDLKAQLTTAHPHYDFATNSLVNVITYLGSSSKYIAVEMTPQAISRQTIAFIPVKKPGYLHSFGLSKNYIVLVEFPFTVNPLEILFSGKPYIENYHWSENSPTRFFLINRNDKSIIGPIEAQSCFSFHHVNTHEQGNEIIIDFLAYPNASIVQSLYIDNLMSAQKKLEAPKFYRYRINKNNNSIKQESLFDIGLELPRINYKSCNAKNYQYAYAVGQSNDSIYLDLLVKLDLKNNNTIKWQQEFCFPSEPVFITKPDGPAEDDGLILSVVLDTKKQTSFLLILDAKNMQEIAQAQMPNIMPFGFHGQFYGGSRLCQ